MSGKVDSPSTGFMSGTITDGNGTGALTCMADVDAQGSDRKIVSCVGQSPGDTTKMFNVLFISKASTTP